MVVAPALFIPLLRHGRQRGERRRPARLFAPGCRRYIDRDELPRPFVHELIVHVLLLVMAVIATSAPTPPGHRPRRVSDGVGRHLCHRRSGQWLGLRCPSWCRSWGWTRRVVSRPGHEHAGGHDGAGLIYFTIAGLLLSLKRKQQISPDFFFNLCGSVVKKAMFGRCRHDPRDGGRYSGPGAGRAGTR